MLIDKKYDDYARYFIYGDKSNKNDAFKAAYSAFNVGKAVDTLNAVVSIFLLISAFLTNVFSFLFIVTIVLYAAVVILSLVSLSKSFRTRKLETSFLKELLGEKYPFDIAKRTSDIKQVVKIISDLVISSVVVYSMTQGFTGSIVLAYLYYIACILVIAFPKALIKKLKGRNTYSNESFIKQARLSAIFRIMSGVLIIIGFLAFMPFGWLPLCVCVALGVILGSVILNPEVGLENQIEEDIDALIAEKKRQIEEEKAIEEEVKAAYNEAHTNIVKPTQKIKITMKG